MDERTLMFIANKGAGRQKPAYPQRENRGPPQQPLQCYKCRGEHLMRDCPHTEIIRVNAYCPDCGITHLILDCPKKLNKGTKVTMNILDVIPSAGSSVNDNIVPVQVVTRAQAQAKEAEEPRIDDPKTDAPSKTTQSTRNTWKARKERMKARKQCEHEALPSELKRTQQKLREKEGKTTPTPVENPTPPQ